MWACVSHNGAQEKFNTNKLPRQWDVCRRKYFNLSPCSYMHCIIIDLSVLFFILTLSLWLLWCCWWAKRGFYCLLKIGPARGPHSSRPTNNSTRFCTQPAAHFSSLVRALPLKIKNNTLSLRWWVSFAQQRLDTIFSCVIWFKCTFAWEYQQLRQIFFRNFHQLITLT